MTKSSRSSSLRSTTPPAVPTINVSSFVRGGIYDLTDPTTVMSNGTELGTWYPRGQGVTAVYAVSSNTSNAAFPSDPATTTMRGSQGQKTTGVNVDALNSAVAKLHEYLGRLPQATDEEETNG